VELWLISQQQTTNQLSVSIVCRVPASNVHPSPSRFPLQWGKTAAGLVALGRCIITVTIIFFLFSGGLNSWIKGIPFATLQQAFTSHLRPASVTTFLS
jgi:hypothetical protein